ncbi:MAG TPA: hypothetical protein VGC13_13505 [Longimicrobium sp.]|jgi:hypothetical protein|uniref:hypothetical protein n=1 Tax=Longimicrobium sp. TaxID=2029185 RepID=UPI002ED7D523
MVVPPDAAVPVVKAVLPLSLRLALHISPPPAKAAWSRWKQGAKCFGLPLGHTCILLPQQFNERQEAVFAHRDVACSQHLQNLFLRMGFREDAHWSVKHVDPRQGLPDELARQHNLVSLCGPAYNPFVRDLLRSPGFLKDVHYYENGRRDSREFLWRNRAYHWNDTTDYALVAIKRNRRAPGRRIIIIFGLRDIGTFAAGCVFALKEYRSLRQEASGRFGSSLGEIEFLLRVDHTPDRSHVTDVRLATEEDGSPLRQPGADAAIVEPDGRALARIYESLRQHPRPIILSDVLHQFTFQPDGSVEMLEEYTLTAEARDLVYVGKTVGGSPEVQALEAVRFNAQVVNGVGEVVALPAENRPDSKRFLLFPIPPVLPGKTAPRIRMTSTWPNGAQALARIGGTDDYTFSISPYIAAPVDSVRVVFRFRDPDARYSVREQFEVALQRQQSIHDYERPFEHTLLNVEKGQRISFAVQRVG